ncbi:MAG TPA: type VI secretion system baseplate subunit TssE [Chthoniobacteraceae bacterium]|jgi:type VI secretion system protein ImpF|nr:type VI secretion system baseplate subunit TssE [Chthoniobacteraceae bacterium]
MSQPDSDFPCLLDRIIGTGEGMRDRGISLADYRKAVLRDLKWLLNSPPSPRFERVFTARPIEGASLHDRDDQLRDEENPRGWLFPYVRKSVLNYGFRSLAGLVTKGLDPVELERDLREAIITFEPRFIPQSVVVKISRERFEAGKVVFEIKAKLWALPHIEPVQFRSELDLETGACAIQDES